MLNRDPAKQWSYEPPWLEMHFSPKSFIVLNNGDMGSWGKKRKDYLTKSIGIRYKFDNQQ